MEKICMGFGFGITVVCFFLCMCVGMQFTWGVLFGMVVTFFSEYFLEE